LTSDQPGVVTGFSTMLEIGGQETPRRHGSGETLDMHSVALTQDNSILDEPCSGLTEHDTTRWCHRFHPLGHAHLLTDCGVYEMGGADLATASARATC
jgi:hypothetical protein